MDLVVARTEPPPHVLVVQHLDLEGEVLLHVLDDHDEVGQLDAQRLLGIRGTRDEGCAHICANDLQDKRLQKNLVIIRQILDKPIIGFVPTWIS